MPTIITGSDAATLYLHEEMRTWRQRGVAFVLAKDGTISILSEDRDAHREAQNYRSKHADALRRYLAFVGDRDPDEAMRHLEFAWELRGVCVRNEKGVAMSETPEPYVPAKVAPLEREKSGIIRKLDQNKAEGDELRAKLTELNNRIAETLGSSES